MSHSVENAKEIFGNNSLYYVLFQELIWADPPYTRSEAAAFIPLYRMGGIQDLPAAFSGVATVRESFRGLDESIHLQEVAGAKWRAVLAGAVARDVRGRMESDVAWFMATASRYRLMAATCDYVMARQNQLGSQRAEGADGAGNRLSTINKRYTRHNFAGRSAQLS